MNANTIGNCQSLFDGKICNSHANVLQISGTKFPRSEGRCNTDEIYPFKTIMKILEFLCYANMFH